MSGFELQASNIKPPYDKASNDVFEVRKIDSDTTHKATEVTEWAGRYVVIYASGGNVHFGFSRNASAEIDSTVVASDAGATTKVGGVIADGLGLGRHVRIPSLSPPTSKMYLIHESDAANTVLYVELAA